MKAHLLFRRQTAANAETSSGGGEEGAAREKGEAAKLTGATDLVGHHGLHRLFAVAAVATGTGTGTGTGSKVAGGGGGGGGAASTYLDYVSHLPGKNSVLTDNTLRDLILRPPPANAIALKNFDADTLRAAFTMEPGPVPGFTAEDVGADDLSKSILLPKRDHAQTPRIHPQSTQQQPQQQQQIQPQQPPPPPQRKITIKLKPSSSTPHLTSSSTPNLNGSNAVSGNTPNATLHPPPTSNSSTTPLLVPPGSATNGGDYGDSEKKKKKKRKHEDDDGMEIDEATGEPKKKKKKKKHSHHDPDGGAHKMDEDIEIDIL